MTHNPEVVQAALELASEGRTAVAIARSLGIPRSTVNCWLRGDTPNRWRRPAGCTKCGHDPHDFESLPAAYTHLLGLYLGDGSIASHPRGVYKLRLSLDAAYPGIIEEAVDATRQVLPKNKVSTYLRPTNDVEVYSLSKSWPCLFPQHGPGKKHLRRIFLSDWQQKLVKRTPQLLLRGLIHSDGCRFMNVGRGWAYPRYSLTNLSPDIRLIFTNACDELGIHWTSAGPKIYVSRKADVDRMDTFIGPKA